MISLPAINSRKSILTPLIYLKKTIRKSLNNCNLLISKEQKWKHLNLNSTVPSLRGFIKIHKPEAPTRPIVNWQNAPT
jgi:hypothetical protein